MKINPGSWQRSVMAGLLAMLAGAIVSCAAGPPAIPTSPAPSSPVSTTTPSPTSTPTPTAAYSQYQLGYLLLSRYPDFFWCDPDFYPVGRPGGEEANAGQQFPDIQANSAEFSAVLEHLGWPVKADYTDEEKLEVYREHKKLTRAISVTLSGSLYNFSLRVGKGQGQLIEGTITSSGQIKVIRQEPSFNTCPICLAEGTLIDTPVGRITVEQLQVGMTVWTISPLGEPVSAPIIKVVATPVPSDFQVIRISLDDGRTLTASPGHPTAEMRALGDYRPGDNLDGGQVNAAELIGYRQGVTYDILPSGLPGVYRANGIWLKSTLK